MNRDDVMEDLLDTLLEEITSRSPIHWFQTRDPKTLQVIAVRSEPWSVASLRRRITTDHSRFWEAMETLHWVRREFS